MKKILFITTQYRVGERIYPIIPILSEQYELHLLKSYQMSSSYQWTGDRDLRNEFDLKYLKYFTKVFDSKYESLDYDLIICDDNRDSVKTPLKEIYKKSKCKVVSCYHGNGSDAEVERNFKKVFDHCFVFGEKDNKFEWTIPGGIPSNDLLKHYQHVVKKHILVIVNFLGNRMSPEKVNFDEAFFSNSNLIELQRYYNLPIVIKLKSRADEGIYLKNVQYLNSIIKNLTYEIVVDTEDDNKLIAESACVISAFSTLAFKSIQLGIPTVLIKDSGPIGTFGDYDGIFKLQDNFQNYLLSYSKKSDFIKSTIEGGDSFSSTEIMVEQITNIINENN